MNTPRLRDQPHRSRRVGAIGCLLTAGLCAAALADDPMDFDLDGRLDEWTAVAATADPAGDATIRRRLVWLRRSGADFRELRATLRDDALYLAVDLGREIVLQRGSRREAGNGIRLLIDADANAATGQPIDGLGVEMIVDFGDRMLRWFDDGALRDRSLNALGLVTAPTHSARHFEIRVPRRAPSLWGDDAPPALAPAGGRILSDRVRLVLRERSSGDRLPDNGSLTFDLEPPRSESPVFEIPGAVAKARPTDLRLLVYNVERDGIAKTPAPFERLFRAVQPDLVALQEVWEWSTQDAGRFLDRVLPLENGRRWQVAKVDDTLTASPTGITWRRAIDGNLAVLLEPTELAPNGLALFNVHTPCCEDDEGRDREHRALASAWRELAEGGESLPDGVDAESLPIVLAGDFNMVGMARQLETIVAGAPPTGSRRALEEVPLRHLDAGWRYTWRRDRSAYSPGRLDWVFFSADAATLGRHFLIWTPGLDAERLRSLGLRRQDSLVSDHLPMVIDLDLVGDNGTPIEMRSAGR